MLCGIDEAGRGPLAGPVCAAAVVLPENFPVEILADSKKLNPHKREEARRIIVEQALAWGVAWASHTEIDKLNILQASLYAMRLSFEAMLAKPGNKGQWPQEPETISFPETPFSKPFPPTVQGGPPAIPDGLHAVADGLYVPDLPIPCTALVKADAKVPEVMAASILAKTARDQLMVYYGSLYPEYGYERHKGYPTREHRGLVLKYGPSPIQRLSFKVEL